MNEGGLMDGSYSGETAVKPPEKPVAEEKESVDEENAGATEILVTKSKLPGKKEGDSCTFKVVKDFGDELSLEYVKPGGKTDESTNDTLNAATDGEIAALDTED